MCGKNTQISIFVKFPGIYAQILEKAKFPGIWGIPSEGILGIPSDPDCNWKHRNF